MRCFKFLVICVTLLFGLLDVCRAAYCGFPGTSANSRVEFSREALVSGTFAVYSCDEGYRLLGTRSRYCLDEGKWSATLPVCVVNVALNKPANSSSNAGGGFAEHGNDGNLDTRHRKQNCVETNKELSPWWRVDLIQPYDVYAVNIIANADLDAVGQVSNLQVRVGNSSSVGENQLCAWLPDSLDSGSAKEILCAVPVRGRYVSLHAVGNEPTSLSFCELQVLSSQEAPVTRCPVRSAQSQVFQRRCYDFHVDARTTAAKAGKNCADNAGSLVTRATAPTQLFLANSLRRMETTKLLVPPANVWIGMTRNVNGQWTWLNNVTANVTSWADGQPNQMESKSSMCVAMSSTVDYNWQDVLCNADGGWICQFDPTGCGSPEIQPNSTLSTAKKTSYKLGEQIEYHCDIHSQLVGNANRTCLADGSWTGDAAVCRYTDCGEAPKLRDSVQFLLQSRTTFGAEVEYACVGNLSLIGSPRAKCGEKGWTGLPTECRYVNCGHLPAIANGAALLIDGGTFFKARARYDCAENYTLIGAVTLACRDDSTWNESIPICKLKECPIPATFYNGKIVGSNYSLGMTIGYVCDEGYYLSSDQPNSRTCQMDQKWSSEPPTCIPIDCGMPEALGNGTFSLLNEGTTYNKSVVYGCEKNFALVGEQQRFCTIAGSWSASTPRCIVSECHPPEMEENQMLVTRNLTVGTVAIFGCKSGYRSQGPQTLTCHPDGYWTGQRPFCHFLDCGAPPVVKFATHRSSAATAQNGLGTVVTYTCDGNTTLLGDSVIYCTDAEIWSGYPPTCVGCGAPDVVEKGLISGTDYSLNHTVQYACEPGSRLEGVDRRTCHYPGEWSDASPLCREIVCELPPSPVNGSLGARKPVKVGGELQFHCQSGNALIGPKSSTCGLNGLWSTEPPICKYVYCGKPPEVRDAKTSYNGTAYGSIAKYVCKENLFIDGEADIFCTEAGKWQKPPSCSATPVERHFDNKLLMEDDASVGIPRRAADTLTSSTSSGTSQLGMGIGIAIACLLVLLTFVGSVIWIRVRGRKAHSADLPIGRATYVDPNFSFKPAKTTNAANHVQVTKAYVNDAFDSTAL